MLKRKAKYIIGILALLAIALGLVLPPAVYSGDSISISKTEALITSDGKYFGYNEVLSKRTEYGKTYFVENTPAGDRHVLIVSTAPKHYKDNYTNNAEPWKDIDTTFVNGQITKAPYTLTVYPDCSISFYDKRSYGYASLDLATIGGALPKSVAPVYSKDKVTWNDIATDTDIIIEANNTGVSIKRVLKSANAPLNVEFNITEANVPNIRYLGMMPADVHTKVPVIASKVGGKLTEIVDVSKMSSITYPLVCDPSVDLAGVINSPATLYYTGAAWGGFAVRWYWSIGYYGASNLQEGGGCQWMNVTVPQGATINSAHVTLEAFDSRANDTARSYIVGEDADNPTAFTSQADYQARRGTDCGGADDTKRTTAEVEWNPMPDFVANNTYDTPDISTVIQEIVNRVGYASANMTLFIDDHKDNSTHAAICDRVGKPAGETHDLYIDYTSIGVQTDAADDIEDTTATLNGQCTEDGGETIDYYGFVWDDDSDEGDPGNVDPSTPAGTWENGWKSGIGDYGENPFDHGVITLATGTTYYFRAAIHADVSGWFYGDALTFLTKPAAPTNVAATDGVHTDKVVITWTKSFGATDYHVWRDAVDLGAAGDVATFDDVGADPPIITAGVATATDGDSATEVTLSVAGESVADGTHHSYKVVASNASGNSDDSATDVGYRGHGALTYQWYRSAADADAGYGAIGGATTDPYSDVAAPAPFITAGNADASDGTYGGYVLLDITGESVADGAGRWYYCTLSATGAANADTTHDRGYRGASAMTYEWFRSAADADAGYASIAGEGGTTVPYNDINAPADGSGRWYYCTISSVGASNTPQDTTHDRGYRAPTNITTLPASGTGRNWAIINGRVDYSTMPVTDASFNYGTTIGMGLTVNRAGTYNSGDRFSYLLTGLSPATLYYYQAAGGGNTGIIRNFATTGSPNLWEYWNTTCNATSLSTYSSNVTFQTFTSDETAHTVYSIRIYTKRVGSPSTVYVSIRNANAGATEPTGLDLATASLNGNAFSTSDTWYEFVFAEPVSLEPSSEYAIVYQAPSGDGANYVTWAECAAGGLDGGIAGHSHNTGITWTSDAPADRCFEIWGYASLMLTNPNVFTNYIEVGDWLICCLETNTYAPYYSNDDDPAAYFYLQLVDANTDEIKASTPVRYWERQPMGLYLRATETASLTWQGDYNVRMVYGANTTIYQECPIADIDWRGDDMQYLDQWIRVTAANLETYYGTYDANTEKFTPADYLTSTATKGTVLSDEGGVLYARGIPQLTNARPSIFLAVERVMSYSDKAFTGAGEPAADAWETRLGARTVTLFTSVSTALGMDSPKLAAGIVLIGIYLVIAIICGIVASPIVGFVAGFPYLGILWYVGILTGLIFWTIAFMMVAILFWKIIIEKIG